MPELHASLTSQLVIHAADLRALARHLVGPGDADDCVQDTMVAALAQPTPPRSIAPWLRQVLRNRVRTGARRDRRRRDRERHTDIPDPAPSPDDHAVHRELVGAVWQALDELEDPYRSALRARFIEGRSPIEIARSEGEPPGTVRWRVHEGLRRMRETLDRRYEGRNRWCGALVAAVGLPADLATPAVGAPSTMTKSLLIKTLAATAAITAAAAIVYGTTATPADAATSVTDNTPYDAAQALAAADPGAVAAAPDRLASHDPALAADDEDCETCGFGDDGIAPQRRHQPLITALESCTHLLEKESLDKRIEVNAVLVGGPPDVGAMIQTLEATHGRPFPCADGVDLDEADNAADGPDVVHLRAVSECIRESMDTSGFTIAEGETQKFMMAFGGDSDDAQPEGGALPTLEGEPNVDPFEAVAKLKLGAVGGPSDPAVEVIECTDYDCPFCRKAEATVAKVLEAYPTVAVHVMHNPLPMHRGAVVAARAAVAAQQQDRFADMHRFLFQNPKARTEAALVAQATAMGLDAQRFVRDMHSDETSKLLARQKQACNAGGARGTPSFFVGDDMLVGARPFDELAATIDEALIERTEAAK